MQTITRKTEKKNNSAKSVEKIDVRTFGGLTIFRNGSPITISWESQKARLLFCCLLVTYDQWVHRQKLLEAIWPGCNMLSGEKNFKTTLSRLRKSFSGASCLNPVLTQGEAVRLNFDVVGLDASRFKNDAAQGIKLLVRGEIKTARKLLESAQDLYFGEFLPEEPYNQFITAERHELTDTYASVIRALEKSYQLEGNHDAIEVFSFLKTSPLAEMT
jgi:SARP family transcriptional regulator, regulator of embCAB operon